MATIHGIPEMMECMVGTREEKIGFKVVIL
jgi:hypothetical protein